MTGIMLLVLCLAHPCSNDALTPPVIGDEVIQWDVSEGADHYEATADDGATVCWSGQGHPAGECLDVGPQGRCRARASRTVNISTTDCAPRHNATACIRIRACASESCSAWSSECVEFRGHPWAVFRAASKE